MNMLLAEAVEHWQYVAPLVHLPANEEDYDALVSHLDTLLAIVGHDERHPLVGLVDIILDALRFLMQEHGLTQSDFKQEIGSQGVVSEILNGRRKLTVKHIKNLAARFQVSPATFID